MNHAFIHNTDGTSKPVKNLGWLLRNWQIVERFDIHQPDCHKFENWDVLMVAHLKDGRKYSTTWADATHCREWLHRPVFIGVPLNFVGEETVC